MGDRKPLSTGMGCLVLLGVALVARVFLPSDEPAEVSEGGVLGPPACLLVGAPLLATLGATSASAVRIPVPEGPGLGRRGAVWFVATANGATWVTNTDPALDQSGLILPLNAAARAASEVGSEVPPGAPVYSGMTDAHEAAQAARACAVR